jgi:eukaryotic-like serine/threonine-protein kinase
VACRSVRGLSGLCFALLCLCLPACPAADSGVSSVENLHCPEGMKPIAGGAFEMGSAFEVTLDSYCLDATEVTVSDYERCVQARRCAPSGTIIPTPGEADLNPYCNRDAATKAKHPINCVTWKSAGDYCSYAGKRLPSEAEWEYAARGGASELPYPWGRDAPADATACWNPFSKRRGTCPVGSYPATTFGLHDMGGNVSEFVADWFADYPSKAQRNYHGPAKGTAHITRGGGWSVGDPMLMHGVVRNQRAHDYLAATAGFRCAR